MPKSFRYLAILGTIAAVLVVSAFLSGFVGNSARRVHREHGLLVPASASNFICGGDAWIIVMDRGAASAFEMAQGEVASFISQLRIRVADANASAIFPGNPQYQIRVPWLAGAAIMTNCQCISSTGDSLHVQVWRINDARAGVLLYTDWN